MSTAERTRNPRFSFFLRGGDHEKAGGFAVSDDAALLADDMLRRFDGSDIRNVLSKPWANRDLGICIRSIAELHSGRIPALSHTAETGLSRSQYPTGRRAPLINYEALSDAMVELGARRGLTLGTRFRLELYEGSYTAEQIAEHGERKLLMAELGAWLPVVQACSPDLIVLDAVTTIEQVKLYENLGNCIGVPIRLEPYHRPELTKHFEGGWALDAYDRYGHWYVDVLLDRAARKILGYLAPIDRLQLIIEKMPRALQKQGKTPEEICAKLRDVTTALYAAGVHDLGCSAYQFAQIMPWLDWLSTLPCVPRCFSPGGYYSLPEPISIDSSPVIEHVARHDGTVKLHA
jgi:hypothetical protein